MKKINICIIVSLVAILFASCEDNDKSPLVLPIAENGSFVTLTSPNVIFDLVAIQNGEETTVNGLLGAPTPNVARYDLEVQRISQGTASNFVPIFSTETFPSEFAITPEEVAEALDLPLEDFLAGDRFEFRATSTDFDGNITNFANIDPDLQAETGQRQAYSFTSFISCPVDFAEIEGTYEVTAFSFGATFPNSAKITTRTVVAGPGPNQLTIVEGEYPAEGSEPLIIDFDPANGIILGGGLDEDGENALAFTQELSGITDNTYLVEDGGFYFSCIGSLLLVLNFEPFNANPHPFELQKIQ